jgi:hypothetical protein
MPAPLAPALFRHLLGDAYEELPTVIREVHDAPARRVWKGRCTVERGASPLSRLAGLLMALPPPGDHAAIEVIIERGSSRETWTRCIGGRRMRSRLSASRGWLAESMGPCVFRFALQCDRAQIHWRLLSVRLMGLPMPASWFHIEACESAQDACYCFRVRVSMAGAGLVVAYDGTLDTRGDA